MEKKAKVNAALEQGLQLFAYQREKRSSVREKTREALGELSDAHWLSTSVVANAIWAVSGKPGKSDPDLALLLSLSASFIQGIDICETAISEGLYVSATALLKQEMETIAAIHEVRNKTRKSGSTPNVRSLRGLSVLYGDLNKVAHVSDSELMQSLVRIEMSGQQSGAPLYPVLDTKLAKFLYGLHVSFLTMMAIEVETILEDLYGAGLQDFELDMVARAGQILQKEGWLPS
jgi:hypothetical protein